jgi:hypothetical protein
MEADEATCAGRSMDLPADRPGSQIPTIGRQADVHDPAFGRRLERPHDPILRSTTGVRNDASRKNADSSPAVPCRSKALPQALSSSSEKMNSGL